MKTLVVDDDFTNRILLQGILSKFSDVHVAVSGDEACEAVRNALAENAPYDLICLDVMMPGMSGNIALTLIREFEVNAGISLGQGAKIMMITGVNDSRSIMKSFTENCDAYLVKPVSKQKIVDELTGLGLLK